MEEGEVAQHGRTQPGYFVGGQGREPPPPKGGVDPPSSCAPPPKNGGRAIFGSNKPKKRATLIGNSTKMNQHFIFPSALCRRNFLGCGVPETCPQV